MLQKTMSRGAFPIISAPMHINAKGLVPNHILSYTVIVTIVTIGGGGNVTF